MRLIAIWLTFSLLLIGCAPIAAPSASSPAASPPVASTSASTDSVDTPASSSVLAFVNVRLFDGDELWPTADVIVTDGVITEVGTGLEIPEEAHVIDGGGKTLLPGLIDAHTHVFTEDALRQALVFGVTTELDMFTDYQFAAQMRQEQAAGEANDRADIFSAGTLATAPGGHGTQFGLQIPTLTSADQAESFVADRIAEGSDYIKVIIEDGSEMGMVMPSLDEEIVTAVISAAKAQGMLTVVHVQTLDAARQAVAAGADGLAHIFVDAVADTDFVHNAVVQGIFVIPTLSVMQHIGHEPLDTTIINDPFLSPYLTSSDIQSLNSPYTGFDGLSLANAQETVRLLFEAGIPILAGTDALNPGTAYGASMHRELVLLTEAGLSPIDALRSATSATADVFSLDDRGRIAPGQRADLLLVNGDPTVEITATRDIVGVWKAGVVVNREAYLANLEAQITANAKQLDVFNSSDEVFVSDFESGEAATTVGAGWGLTTDQPAGGTSTVTYEIVEGGVGDSSFAMEIQGEVGDAVPFAWAGISYYPGATAFSPFDLSGKPTLSFMAKGEGGPFRIQLFCDNVGQVPPEQAIETTAEWQEFTFDLSTFDDCNIAATQAIIFSAGPTPGNFTLQLDDVRFE